MSILFASIPQFERDHAPARTPDAAQVHADDRACVRALVDRARDGDAVAFGAIYDRFHAQVHRYALARVDWNQADAEDVLAETFIDAWRAVPRYHWTGAPFLAWLFAICSRRVAMHHRTASRRPQRAAGEDLASGLADDSGAIAGSDGELEAAALRVHLAQLLAQLSDDQRSVLELRFFGSLTTDEIAVVLQRSAGAIRQLQMRALAELRGLIDPAELAR